MNTLGQRQLQVHIPVVAVLLILGHGLFLLVAAFIFLLLTGIGIAVQEETATPVLAIVGTVVALFLAALALPGLAAGFGLLAHKAWGRILAIVVAFLGLVNIPVGTLLGLYSGWVLLQDAATDYFVPQARAAPADPPPATPQP